MDNNFFKKTRILDGGMGQELLARGLKAKGSLWSASALIEKKYHQLIIDVHLDFINSGADVIVTTSFTTRRTRLRQHNSEKYFEYANEKSGELAIKAKEISKKNVLIAAGLPGQNNTYEADARDSKIIHKDFYDQAQLLKPFADFFYLDVISSGRECDIASNIVYKLNLPLLVGLHVSKNGKLPSNESITDVVKKYKSNNWLGVITACVSPEIIEQTTDELKSLNIPFGFKVNLWKEEPLPAYLIQPSDSKSVWGKNSGEIGINPNEVLGSRKDFEGKRFFEFAKKIMNKGATILGGCCETKPSHIKEMAKLK